MTKLNGQFRINVNETEKKNWSWNSRSVSVNWIHLFLHQHIHFILGRFLIETFSWTVYIRISLVNDLNCILSLVVLFGGITSVSYSLSDERARGSYVLREGIGWRQGGASAVSSSIGLFLFGLFGVCCVIFPVGKTRIDIHLQSFATNEN